MVVVEALCPEWCRPNPTSESRVLRRHSREIPIKLIGMGIHHAAVETALVPSRKAPTGARADYTPTPDKRYFVVRGRLWRLSNPSLDPETHQRLVRDLMNGRRAIAHAPDRDARIAARLRVDAAKRALGERGDPWWDDGAPDYNRKLAIHTPYAEWFTQC